MEQAVDTERSQVSNYLPTVRIAAIEEKYERAPVFVCPGFDDVSKQFITGSEKAPEEVRKKAIELFVKKDEKNEEYVESFPIRHGMTLNPNLPFDAAVLNLARVSGVVAESRATIRPSKHRFFIEDKEEEATKTISEFELQMKAYEAVKQYSTLDDQVDICTLLGLSVFGFTKKQVEGALTTKCKTKPLDVINLFNDPERKLKMFIARTVRFGIVKENKGVHKYGDIVIGSSLQKAIEWFRDKANSDLTTQISDLLKEKSKG